MDKPRIMKFHVSIAYSWLSVIQRTVTDGWWCGVVGSPFRLKRSYSTPGPVSTAMGDSLRAETAIGFRASREH